MLTGGKEDLSLGAHTVGQTLLVGTVYGMNFNHMPEIGLAVGLPVGVASDASNLCLGAR